MWYRRACVLASPVPISSMALVWRLGVLRERGGASRVLLASFESAPRNSSRPGLPAFPSSSASVRSFLVGAFDFQSSIP